MASENGEWRYPAVGRWLLDSRLLASASASLGLFQFQVHAARAWVGIVAIGPLLRVSYRPGHARSARSLN